jgi:hypothetical protein
MMRLVSIRLPQDTVERLRALARREAAQRNKDVTWSGLVRRAIDALLATGPEKAAVGEE